ncbi:MAG: GCN5-related N-acetyltransferase [Fluviicola sp.]|jgi:predicted GNAT family N-acyltransferase|uniref:GNAT family N-acetyltransferase n=1 Tax=Fluviicola sp. TaxID=1917219 RepID=UPI00263025CE|nr:GNAT family N-acetyltransferase [Fluviicola sp.]MDF3029075.1 GCN5-related N-acetyltransferase [Fluviicola sp.]
MNQFQTNIRLYNPSDRDACMNAFKSNVPKYFTLEEVDEFERFLTKLADPEAIDNPPYYVMELDDKLIGCGGFGKKDGIDGTACITFVWGLVSDEHHKKGYGEQLLKFRLTEIKSLFPNRQVILDTTQFSFSFFEKYGFKTVKITENSYGEGMHRYDMVLGTSGL